MKISLNYSLNKHNTLNASNKFLQNHSVCHKNFSGGISFGKEAADTFQRAYNHGRLCGLEGRTGNYSQKLQKNDIKEEYEKGFNQGYIKGKEESKRNYATLGDVIQDFISQGCSREQAIYITADIFGGM